MSDKTTPRPLPSTFVDGIANIGYSGGVVRIDFAELSATARGPDGQPLPERKLRVITTLEGLVAAHKTIQQFVEQLAAQGKLVVAPAQKSAPAGEPTTQD